jgi:hypothetical protein
MTARPQAEDMELELIRGPLDERRLRAVAELYGGFNRKYGDPGFCHRLFDENPQGPALHALVLDGPGEIVGHYAIVPLDIVRDGQRRRAGKGEAFVVRPDQRSAMLSVEGAEPIPIGLAMPLRLYRHALDQGMELVHMIASPEVGLIHRMTGCRSLGVRSSRVGLGVRPGVPPAAGEPAGAHAVRSALTLAQCAASSLARAVTLSGLGRVRHQPVATLDAEALARIVLDARVAEGWTLAVDAPVLTWMARTGGLEVVALDDGLEDYAVVAARAGEGRVMETVLWRQRSRGLRPALRLLAAVAGRAGEQDDLRVEVSLAAAVEGEERERLRAAARLLCFRERAQVPGMVLFTADDYYLDPQNIRFTPFFYAIF